MASTSSSCHVGSKTGEQTIAMFTRNEKSAAPLLTTDNLADNLAHNLADELLQAPLLASLLELLFLHA